MSNKYKTDPAHVRKLNAQSKNYGAAGYQAEFASESATNAQQVRAQNAASANASAFNSAAGFQTEFASESATNAQQVRQQNAQSQQAKNAGAAGYQGEFASESATDAQQVRQQNAQSQNRKKHQSK